MSVNDPISDMLTRIRNAGMARKTETTMPSTKILVNIAAILKQEGYIADYVVETGGKFPEIRVTNKYVNNNPAIAGLKRVSKPGLRKYVGATEIPRVLGGMGIAILSTPQGIITGREAKRKNVGGELLAMVW